MKKQKKLTRKERQQLRDEELAKRGVDPIARRQQKSSAGPSPWISSFQSGEEASEAFLEMVVASEPLADEPEMEEFLFDPMQSVEAMGEAAMELGLSPEDNDEASEDTQMEVMERTIQKLLTKQMQQQIKSAVDKLVLRLEEDHDQDKFISASAVQLFMKTIKEKRAWVGIGLVREILRRSLEAGFALLAVVDKELSDKKSISDIIRSLDEESATVKSFSAVLQRIPGLRSLLEKEADKVWDKGIEALDSGKLSLGLFSLEELMGGVKIFDEILHGEVSDETADRKIDAPIVTKEQGKVLITRLAEYLTELLTPERLAQFRSRLDMLLDSEDRDELLFAFVNIVRGYMAEEDAVENEMYFLMHAFFGEVRHYDWSTVETTEDDE